MLDHHHGPPVLATFLLIASGLVAACDAGTPAAPRDDPLDVEAIPAAANAAFVAHGTFTDPGPFPPVNAPCVDNELIAVTGTWSGWFRVAQTARGHLHITEHVDWSDVTLVATDGRTWKPGPGAHESFSLNLPATGADLGESAYNVMHNLRARFNSQDGDSDLQVWHTIHQVLGPDLEFRVFKIVLPFEGKCIGGGV